MGHLFAVLVAHLIVVCVICFVLAVNAVTRWIRDRKQMAKANVFRMSRSAVTFKGTLDKAVVVRTKTITFGAGAITVCAETSSSV